MTVHCRRCHCRQIGILNNPANWGVYNNRPVVLDLGFTEETAELYGFKRR